MPEEEKQCIPSSNILSYCKVISAVFVIVAAIWGGMLTMDNRYATAEDLNTMQQQTVKTFEEFRKSMKQDDLQRKFTFLTERYYNLKDLLRKYPNDTDMQNEINDIKNQLDKIKEQMESVKQPDVEVKDDTNVGRQEEN